MYPTSPSQLPPTTSSILSTMEAGPPPCSCPQPRDHECNGECFLDEPCDCCEGTCSCPPRPGPKLCAHQRQWRLYADWLWPEELQKLPRPAHQLSKKGKPRDPSKDAWYTDAYQDPPEADGPLLADTVAERVELMRERVTQGVCIFDPGPLHLEALEEMAVQTEGRGRNGNDVTAGAIGLERVVRHASG